MSNKPYLEACIVAFNYIDLLSITLPRNLEVLDHVIVLTKPGDPVVEYCESLKSDKITVVQTTAFNHDGAIFNKGLGIDVGFTKVKYHDWVITLDSDIVLPPDFRDKFLAMPPDPEYIYGSRRYDIKNKQEWDDLESGRKRADEFPLYRGFGYGYHTVFNYKSSSFQKLIAETGGLPYPYWIKEARDIDWLFVRNWKAASMVYSDDPPNEYPNMFLVDNKDSTVGLLREIPCYVYHLGAPGLNHETRVTPEFK